MIDVDEFIERHRLNEASLLWLIRILANADIICRMVNASRIYITYDNDTYYISPSWERRKNLEGTEVGSSTLC